ncbi:hypothetical protein OKA05_28575 [Luteolibacter arcticus]|uniref:Uncharacterized protein n=1 Tax=Luteolibacter arcticus TaxID=1581411 RepID=A0ABT3GSM9_9BACT|nr:hypothetical protein [Luteolibacter arcticus]MCW1926541.1 hypothetical protein [Luteolibacter arcticus]
MRAGEVQVEAAADLEAKPDAGGEAHAFIFTFALAGVAVAAGSGAERGPGSGIIAGADPDSHANEDGKPDGYVAAEAQRCPGATKPTRIAIGTRAEGGSGDAGRIGGE